MRAGRGPFILIAGHRGDMGVRIYWEPYASTGRAIWGLVMEDFIDGSRWVRWKGGGEIPELSCMYVPGWRRLYRCSKELLEMRLKYVGELSR